MKKIIVVLFSVFLLISLAGCVDTNTAKSSELSSQYDYYKKSVDKIRTDMKITPDQADEVFIALVDCGLDTDIQYVFEKSESGTTYYDVSYGGNSLSVYLNNGDIERITSGRDILYPEEKLYNLLMDYELYVEDLKSDSGSIVGQYAFIKIPKSWSERITDYHFKEFVETRVKDSKYNWVSIIFDDDTGICFAGSSTLAATYGELDSNGSVVKPIGTILLDESGNYTYTENE